MVRAGQLFQISRYTVWFAKVGGAGDDPGVITDGSDQFAFLFLGEQAQVRVVGIDAEFGEDGIAADKDKADEHHLIA